MSRPEPAVELLSGGREEAHRHGIGAAHVSRSYSAPWALVATHHAPVGVDIERIGPLDADFLAAVGTPEEVAALHGADDAALTDLWSSKEALAKALGDALDYDPRRLDAPARWSQGRAGRWSARRLEALPAGFTGWLCWTD